MTGARYCAAPNSTTLALDVIAKAKAEGLPVSCAVTINHLTLNENDIGDYRTFLKLKPPCGARKSASLWSRRGQRPDRHRVSDHNPQDVEAKRCHSPRPISAPWAWKPCSRPGCGWSMPANYAGKMLRAMTSRPAEILGLAQGRLAAALPPISMRFDPDEPYVLRQGRSKSRSKNTLFDEARLQGVVKATLVGGEIVQARRRYMERA